MGHGRGAFPSFVCTPFSHCFLVVTHVVVVCSLLMVSPNATPFVMSPRSVLNLWRGVLKFTMCSRKRGALSS